MTDRRRYPRYNTMLEVEYEIANGFDIQSKTYTYNISVVGLSLPLNKAVEKHKKINLTIRVPYEEKKIKAVGKVVWKEPLTKELVAEDKAGVEFLEMDGQSRMVLSEFINQNG